MAHCWFLIVYNVSSVAIHHRLRSKTLLSLSRTTKFWKQLWLFSNLNLTLFTSKSVSKCKHKRRKLPNLKENLKMPENLELLKREINDLKQEFKLANLLVSPVCRQFLTKRLLSPVQMIVEII